MKTGTILLFVLPWAACGGGAPATFAPASPLGRADRAPSDVRPPDTAVLEFATDDATPPAKAVRLLYTGAIPETLFGGQTAILEVEAGWLPRCGTAGTVTALISGDDGTSLELTLDRGVPGFQRFASFSVPAEAHSLDIGFRAEDGDCTETVDPTAVATRPWHPARIDFPRSGAPTVTGALSAGGVTVIQYDIDRLRTCRQQSAANPTSLDDIHWNLIATAAFADKSESGAYYLQGSSVPDFTQPWTIILPLPDGTQGTNLEMWFENVGYDHPSETPSCVGWDNDGVAFGRYRFDIE
jgi:hypothetical protein